MATFGGYGQAAHGRHQYGAPDSVVEPRYDASIPRDEATNVGRNQWAVFTTYFYSSIGDFQHGLLIEVSEDEGATFAPAVLPTYQLVKRVKDGQRFWFKIRKRTGLWPAATYVVIRYTGPDEHGNVATKTVPVRWS